MVAGGFDEMSYTDGTRHIGGTLLSIERGK